MQLTQLYAHYGSRLTSGTSEMLYDALLADDVLSGFFENIDMDALREHMSDLLSALTGGPEAYTGRPMAEAHAPFEITAYHFQRVASHLEASLLSVGISQADTDLIMAEVGKVRGAVVNS
ncbi:MAG: group I truncated hemoglobin [Candidatus Puniceispirillaceae bacterium]